MRGGLVPPGFPQQGIALGPRWKHRSIRARFFGYLHQVRVGGMAAGRLTPGGLGHDGTVALFLTVRPSPGNK